MNGKTYLCNVGEGEAPPSWGGQWISHAKSCRPKGVFYAKRVFDLEGRPGRALVHVAADSRYALFCNGVFVGRGPVRATERAVFFDTYDLRELIQEGRNVLAVAVHVMGRAFFVYVPGTPGLLVEADLAAGGAEERLVTDGEWRVREADAYDEAATLFTFQAGWSELYDARREVKDWTGASVRGWSRPESVQVQEALRGRELRPRMIPALLDQPVRPRAVAQRHVVPACRGEALGDYGRLMHEEPHLEAAPGTVAGEEEFLAGTGALTVSPPGGGRGALILLDLREMVAGYVSFEVEGPPGTIMDLGYNEAVVDGRLPTAHGEREGNAYRFADRYILGGGRREHRHLFAIRAGRYVQVVLRDFSSPVTIHRLQMHLATYPVLLRGRFSCDHLLLDRLYQAGRRTLQLCMLDTYVDCPWREQAMWLGDMYVEMLYDHLTHGDRRLARQCIEMAAHGLTARGLLRSAYPSEAEDIIPSFSLLWVLGVEDYVRYTGDGGVVRVVWDVLCRVMEAFEGQRTESGLLRDFEGSWRFYDWGYAAGEGENGLLALLYVGALRAASNLAERLARLAEAEMWRRRADATAAAVNRCLWDETKRAYRDAFVAGRGACGGISQHTQALVMFFEVAPPERIAAALDVLERRDAEVAQAEPFYQFFVLTALARLGRLEKALGVLGERFGPMLDSETGTIWECWGGKGRWGDCGSLCHAFSCPMLYLLPTFILGVEPVEDGFARFRCAPQTGGLGFAQGRVPAPFGSIDVSWLDSPEQFGLSLDIPPAETTCELVLPLMGRSILIRDATGRQYAYREDGVRLGAGKYTCIVKK